jgi:hypothetical protein
VNAEATHSDAFSWGVGARQAIYAYDCNFTSAAGSGIYLHNFPASSHAADPSPAIMVFDNCTATGAGSNPGLRMLEEYSQQADTFIWNGGKIKGGTTAAADISIDYLSGVTLSSWVGLIDPTAGTSTSAAGIGISRGVAAAMPQPLAASAMMNSYHYPGPSRTREDAQCWSCRRHGPSNGGRVPGVLYPVHGLGRGEAPHMALGLWCRSRDDDGGRLS